jgi:hypothetical protein
MKKASAEESKEAFDEDLDFEAYASILDDINNSTKEIIEENN